MKSLWTPINTHMYMYIYDIHTFFLTKHTTFIIYSNFKEPYYNLEYLSLLQGLFVSEC